MRRCSSAAWLVPTSPSSAPPGVEPTIQLAPLPREHARTLLENLAGPLDPDAADAVGRATGGNPLFLEEMLRMLVDDGVLVERDGRLEPLESRRLAARAGHRPGGARRAARPARRGRAGGAAAGCGDRAGLLVGCHGRPLAAGGGERGRGPPPGARPQGVDQAGRTHVRGRGRLPLRPHPHPRCRLRLDAEAAAGRAARALRRLDRGPRRRERRARRDRRPPSRAGLRLPC